MLKLLFILFLLEHKKDPGVPNLFPFKEEVLKQAEEKKRRVIFLGVHGLCQSIRKLVNKGNLNINCFSA